MIEIAYNIFLFQTLPETCISSYATSLKDKTALISSLYKVIQEPQSEVSILDLSPKMSDITLAEWNQDLAC